MRPGSLGFWMFINISALVVGGVIGGVMMYIHPLLAIAVGLLLVGGFFALSASKSPCEYYAILLAVAFGYCLGAAVAWGTHGWFQF